MMRPTRRTWFKHLFLLFLAFITCTIAGTIQPFGVLPILPELDPVFENAGFFAGLVAIPFAYFNLIRTSLTLLITDPAMLAFGLKFSLSVLFIMAMHEAGHYVACRIYRVKATLPYFIPTPPLIGPAGTFGAFIKIVSPLPSRKAIFDIGVAGPIAGFVALIPVAILAILTHELTVKPSFSTDQLGIVFSKPILLEFFAGIGNVDLSAQALPNPFMNAAWIGLLVTALNLIPSGQLDGGHAIYGVFGSRVHKATGRIAFAVMALLSVVGYYYYGSPSGFLFAIVLAIMMRIGHPIPFDNTPLDRKRKIIALITLLIFLLSFVPIPVRLS